MDLKDLTKFELEVYKTLTQLGYTHEQAINKIKTQRND